jgi:hypothetical protein
LSCLLGLAFFACVEGFTSSEGSGGSGGTSGGDTSAAGSDEGGSAGAAEGGSGGTTTGGSGGKASGGSAGATSGGKANGGSGGKASGGAPGAGGTPAAGGARPMGGSSSGGASNGGGGTSSGGSSAGAAGSPEAGAGGSATEIPTDGLVLWLRADHGVSVEGEAVTRWADQSGQGNDATPPSTASRPKRVGAGISGLPSIAFDGADDYLVMPSGFRDFSGGVSIFSVSESESNEQCWSWFEVSNASEVDDISFGQWMNAPLYEVFDAFFNGGAFAVGAPQMVSAVHTSLLAVSVRVNQVNSGAMTMPMPVVIERTQNFIGRSLYPNCVPFPGQLAELIVYDRAVGISERSAIETYLRDHWGCCAN